MALPPPLPSRAVAATPPLPSRANPFAKRSNFAVGEKLSSRDVARATGDTFGFKWIFTDSENVFAMRAKSEMDAAGNRSGKCYIEIEFLNGSQYGYANRPMGDFLDLVESSSKGRFTYYEVRGPGAARPGMGKWKPFVKLRGPTRSAEEVRRMRQARNPQTAQQRKRHYTVGGKRNSRGAGGLPVGFG